MIVERHIDSVIDHRQKRVEYLHSIILHAGVHRVAVHQHHGATGRG